MDEFNRHFDNYTSLVIPSMDEINWRVDHLYILKETGEYFLQNLDYEKSEDCFARISELKEYFK